MPSTLTRTTLHAATERAKHSIVESYFGRTQDRSEAPVSLLLDDRPGHALQVLPDVDRPVLVVTANRSMHYLLDVLEQEPEGLLVTPTLPPAQVLEGYLSRIAAGERFYEGPPPSKSLLTPKEREVLRRTMYGESTEKLAASLSITPYTAGEHLRHIREKLDVERNAELVLAYFAGDAARLAV